MQHVTAEQLKRERGSFSLTNGGPISHVLARIGLTTPLRCWLFGIAVWLPLAISEAVRAMYGLPLDVLLFDLSVHTRLLVALPVLLNSERVLDAAAKSAVNSVYVGQLCDATRLDRILDRAASLRDSRLVEATLVAVAVIGGQLALWNVFGPAGWIGGAEHAGTWSFSRVWLGTIGLPVVQVLMFRWLWRWLIWSYVVVSIARLPLVPLATHPDLAGGLGCLARPMSGFSGFVFAIGSVLAGAWATQVIAERTTLQALVPSLVTYLLLALLISSAPLLLFCGHLFGTRRRTLAQYGDFARRYTTRFHEKWITAPVPADPSDRLPALGSPDIQSLSDLGTAYQVISKTRIFVFGPRNVLAIWFSGLLPMMPLFATQLTVEQILKRILTTVLGGLPF